MMDYQEMMDARNNGSDFFKEVGMRVTELRENYCRGEVELLPMHFNPIGSAHGGLIFTLADTVGGMTCWTRGSYVTTLDGSINYLRPALRGKSKKLIGTSREVKVGRHVMIYDVDIHDDQGRLIAAARMSYYVTGPVTKKEEQ